MGGWLLLGEPNQHAKYYPTKSGRAQRGSLVVVVVEVGVGTEEEEEEEEVPLIKACASR